METPDPSVISQADIDAELRRSTGFAGGKIRVYTLYQKQITAKEAIAALKKEYNHFGHSHTFVDGTRGFVDYEPSKGMTMRRYDPKAEVKVSWSKIEKRLRQLIAEGSYLTPDEREQYERNHLEDAPDQETEISAPLEITQADIDLQFRFSAPLHLQNLRIYEVFQRGLNSEDTINELKKAYGRAATGYKFPDGMQGMTDYLPDVGIVIQKTGPDKETKKVTISWPEVEKRVRQLIAEGRYLTPDELEQTAPIQNVPAPETLSAPEAKAPAPTHVPGAAIPVPAPMPKQEITQADIDAALQEWNGDMDSKRRVQRYMTDHARDRGTAEWLKNEYGEDFPA